MAYAESTVGGSSGGQFRVWVNSIRTRQGNAADNSEDWRVEGGLKRVTAGGRIWNNYNAASYTVQLGMNGVASSGNFNYDFGGGTGSLLAWGTGATRVNRNSAGVGFGFTSRMDINLSNSPYLTSGWVNSSDSVATIYRHATLTALSMHAGNIPATDEGPIWLEFSNPSGASVDAWLEAPAPGFPRIYTSAGGQGSRFNYPNLSGGSLSVAMQQAYPNSNGGTLRIGIHDALGGDNWDFRDVSYTIKNDLGQANPTFLDYDYVDENATTVAITGNDQVLIQGKSDLKVTVPVADKATRNKYSTMSSYLFSIGAYSQSLPWSNTLDVVQDIGTVSDVSGDTTLSVRAIDSRAFGTTVTKNVTVLPYASPGFYNNLGVRYANDFDADDGFLVDFLDDALIGAISPLTLGGTDLNEVPSPAGLKYTISWGEEPYSATWTNIPFTQEAGTGVITADPVALATSIESRYNAITAAELVPLDISPNTVRWHILFELTDAFNEPQNYTVEIDVGEPFFRIGSDGRLYYKEIEFFDTFSGKSDLYYPSVQGYSTIGSAWARTGASGYIGGWGLLYNPGGANGDQWDMDIYMPAGVYQFVVYFYGGVGTAKVDISINGQLLVSAFDTYNAGGNTDKIATSSTIGVLDGATYNVTGTTNGRNAANTTNWINGIFGIKAQRVGDL